MAITEPITKAITEAIIEVGARLLQRLTSI